MKTHASAGRRASAMSVKLYWCIPATAVSGCGVPARNPPRTLPTSEFGLPTRSCEQSLLLGARGRGRGQRRRGLKAWPFLRGVAGDGAGRGGAGVSQWRRSTGRSSPSPRWDTVARQHQNHPRTKGSVCALDAAIVTTRLRPPVPSPPGLRAHSLWHPCPRPVPRHGAGPLGLAESSPRACAWSPTARARRRR